MPLELSPSARRVQETLEKLGFLNLVQEMPASTRTSADAAAALGCQVGQIAKSIVFRTRQSDRPVLVIASGANRVNERKLRILVGEEVEKGSADFVRERTGFTIGGVAPVGHSSTLDVFLDEDLMQYEEIWAAAGSPNAVFRLTPAELVALTQGKVVSIK